MDFNIPHLLSWNQAPFSVFAKSFQLIDLFSVVARMDDTLLAPYVSSKSTFPSFTIIIIKNKDSFSELLISSGVK